MTTRLGYYADRVIELGWLAAALIAPLFFNVYSSRVFEPDKIATIRSVVLIMLVAWVVKLFETGRRAASQSPATTRAGKAGAASQAVVETVAPSWLGFLRVPMVVAILVYALTYIISTIFSVTPEASIFGSYQRLQGTYSQFSYMMLGILVLANMRTRAQFERLINFMLLTSLPVALYGLLQAFRLDPLPWAGDTATRVASSMGNAIFVAAWLIMVVPFTLYRVFLGVSGALTARHAAQTEPEPAEQDRRGRQVRRTRAQEPSGYGWAAVANATGVIIAALMVLFLSLKMMAGMPYPDARTWWLFPLALAIYFGAVLAVEWIGDRRDDPIQRTLILPIVGVAVFLTSFLATSFTWDLEPQTMNLQLEFETFGFLMGLIAFLVWAIIAAAAYAISTGERESSLGADRGIVRASLNVGYGVLLVLQIVCIYLTQSRGPWLGLGMGLVAFVVGMWLIGRRRGVRWMARIGGVASVVVLVGALFVAALNIPNSPLTGLSNLPVVGRGIERLSTLTRTEDGTGKVRRLIWEGATNLILSDPARTVIGWGPESMYVAYNRFYPAELAQVELRNATPDRSHNVEFDQLVTMGAVGLLAYYFLVGSFFYYSIRLLKRAVGTRDQLIALALMAAMAAHFVEIQTGIQIASTWTYFYLIVGMMVAFGYYITTYLRQPEAVAEVAAPSPNGATPEAEAAEEPAEPVAAGTKPVAVAAGAGAGAGARSTVTAQVSGNGKPQAGQTSQKRGRASGQQQPQQARSSGQSGSKGGQGGQASRRPSLPQYGASRAGVSNTWVRNPVMLFVYGVVALVALLGVFRVNSATVQADTLFKQAQAYDNAQRYFRQVDRTTNTVYPGSIDFYKEALSLQPNQDYYYLFLGRAWLEAAKQAPTEQGGNARTGEGYSTDPAQEQEVQAKRRTEELFRLSESERILKQANALSPINTDHYANLGRLYLHWSNPAGGNDPSRAPLAVQYMREAVNRTPGNAQLWYEYGVALARNGQFEEAMEALVHSERDVDPTFADTPFVRGQLLQERAANVRAALVAGQPLPSGGETDFGKLTLEAGRAYSGTIGLDVKRFADTNPQPKLEFLASAADPFTNTNSTVPQEQLANVLTDTVGVAAGNAVDKWEQQMVDRLRALSAPVGEGDGPVPAGTLQQLWSDAQYASGNAEARNWTDPSLQSIAAQGSAAHYLRGLIYSLAGDPTGAREELQRALTLYPANALAAEELQRLGQ